MAFFRAWLAIPPAQQPPNHYRLLALPEFESDEDVISNAADQRMLLPVLQRRQAHVLLEDP